MKKPSVKPSDSKKLGIVFTIKQIEILEKIVSEGKFGSNKAEVIKNIVMKHLTDNHFLD